MIESLFCAFWLVVGLGAFFAIRRILRKTQQHIGKEQLLDAMFSVLNSWVEQGRLTREQAQPVLEQLYRERFGQPVPVTARQSSPAVAASLPKLHLPTLPPVWVADNAVMPAPPQSIPHAKRPPLLMRWFDGAWQAVMSLHTRQLLLVLGAFLVLSSALVLAVFNWTHLAPIWQCGLLLLVCGGIWGAGEALDRWLDMPSAGRALRAISAGLVPAVLFAVARLADVGPHMAWLFAATLCLPLYAGVALRSNYMFYGLAAAFAGANVVTALAGFVLWSIAPAAVIALLVVYLPLAKWLRPRSMALGRGVWLIAHILTPTVVLVAEACALGGVLGQAGLGASLAATTLFYTVAELEKDRRRWAWTAAACGPLAVIALCNAYYDNGVPFFLMLLMGLYVVGATWMHRHKRPIFGRTLEQMALALMPVALLQAMIFNTDTTIDTLTRWVGAGIYLQMIRMRPTLFRGAAFGATLGAALLATAYTFGVADGYSTRIGLMLLACSYVSVARVVRGTRWQASGKGLQIVAVATALALLFATPLPFALVAPGDALVRWCGVGFFALSTWLDRRTAWWWATLLLAPIALFDLLFLANAPQWGIAAALALLANGYIAASLLLRRRWATSPLLLGVAGAVAATLDAALVGVLALQTTLPLIMIACTLLVWANQHGRLRGLPFPIYDEVAASALGALVVLLAGWSFAMLDLLAMMPAWRGVVILSWAALAFLAARFWPGRLHRLYAAVLQMAAVLVAVASISLASSHYPALVVAACALASILAMQTLLQREVGWAAAALLAAQVAAELVLDYTAAPPTEIALVAMVITAAYTIGGRAAHRTAWGFLTWPATILGAGGATVAAGWQFQNAVSGAVMHPAYIAMILVFAALAAVHSALWKRPELGFVAAPLMVISLALAGQHGFWIGPPLRDEQYVIVLCAAALLFVYLDMVLPDRVYAIPYLATAGVALLFGLLLSFVGPFYGTVAWNATALFGSYLTLRFRLRWLALPSLLAFDAGVLFGIGWLDLLPGRQSIVVSLLISTWAQGLLGMAARIWQPWLRCPIYVATTLAALAAYVAQLVLLPSSLPTAAAVFVLAALSLAITLVEGRQPVAWVTFGLIVLGFGHAHLDHGQHPWSFTLLVIEMLALCVIGWLLEWLDPLANRSRITIWRQPLGEGAVIVGALATLGALRELSTTTIATVMGLFALTLLLATLALRRRSLEYAYASAGILVATVIAQFSDWGLRSYEWFLVPAGLYLLAVADGTRRRLERVTLAKAMECGAAALLLGTAAAHAIAFDTLHGTWLTLSLCLQSAALLAYGVLRRLQVPTVGGAIGVVFGVLWLCIDPLRAANTWVVIGLCGLLLLALYVVLERYQERLVRNGRQWIGRVSSWG